MHPCCYPILFGKTPENPPRGDPAFLFLRWGNLQQADASGKPRLSRGVGAKEQTMNTKHGLFIGIALILLAAIFTFTGCSDDSGGPTTVTYTGTADGTTYTLKITDDTSYELTVGTKTSSGSAVKNGGSFTLTPTGKTTSFTVTVSGNGITAMSGTITFSDDTTQSAPSTITPPSTGGGNSSIVGKWKNSSNGFVIEFKSNGQGEGSGESFTYTYSGTTLTIKVGATKTYTGKAVVSDNTLTISEFPDPTGLNGSYTPQ
jgi:hypothetical protein